MKKRYKVYIVIIYILHIRKIRKRSEGHGTMHDGAEKESKQPDSGVLVLTLFRIEQNTFFVFAEACCDRYLM